MASNPLTGTNTPASQRAQGEYAHEANDEIDLAELIRALWAGKWLILSITLASTLIALIYLQIFPYYTVSFTVKANPIAEKHVYDVLNEAIDLLAGENKDRFVDNDLLAQLWIEDMTRYETIEQALIDHHYLPEKTDETEREFKRRLRYKAHQYELSADDAKANTTSPSWSMKFTSHMPETDRVVLEQALSQSNSNVRTVLEEKFRYKVNAHKQKNSDTYAELDKQQRRLVLAEQERSEQRLAFLTEQSQIARSLGIDVPDVLEQSSNLSNLYNVSFYLRGFKAIDTEIALLQEREIELYIGKLVDLRNQQREIQQAPQAAQAQLAFDATPLQSDSFRALRYDLTDLQIRNKLTLILALAIIMGGILGMLVLLIRNASSNRDNAA